MGRPDIAVYCHIQLIINKPWQLQLLVRKSKTWSSTRSSNFYEKKLETVPKAMESIRALETNLKTGSLKVTCAWSICAASYGASACIDMDIEGKQMKGLSHTRSARAVEGFLAPCNFSNRFCTELENAAWEGCWNYGRTGSLETKIAVSTWLTLGTFFKQCNKWYNKNSLFGSTKSLLKLCAHVNLAIRLHKKAILTLYYNHNW